MEVDVPANAQSSFSGLRGRDESSRGESVSHGEGGNQKRKAAEVNGGERRDI